MAFSTLHQRRSPSIQYLTYLRIPNDIQQADHIRSPCEVLQNLDLSLDLLLLDGFQDFDDALLVGREVNALEDLRVSWFISVYLRRVARANNRIAVAWDGLQPTSEYFPRPTLRTIS